MNGENCFDIVIVGAGPGGSAAALALDYYFRQRKRESRILVIDKRSKERERSNTVLLDEAPASALHSLGCDLSKFTPATDWCQINPEEAEINRYPLNHYQGGRRKNLVFNAGFMLRRTPVFDVGINLLEDVMYEEIGKSGITLAHETCLSSLAQLPDGSFQLGVDSKTVPRQVHCRYIVAADGAKSNTLNLLGARKKGSRKLETIVSASFTQSGVGNTKYHNNNRSVEALSLATRQGTSVFVKVPPEIEQERGAASNAGSSARLMSVLIEGARKLGVESEIGYGFSVIPIFLARSEFSIYRKNIFVIGDARHSTTPRVALGANVAIMDALRAARAIVQIECGSSLGAHLARVSYRLHTWLGTHILTWLGGVTTASQSVKARSSVTKPSKATRLYKFWKTQVLMSIHWRAARGAVFSYDESNPLQSLEKSRSNRTNNLQTQFE